ncbi:MAG: 4Fe-4S ferredoxin [Candidatus Omnitrophica bacterium]|nr:4Fe-4S ferredoxin [Candidatus Omnitrophota bacterium]
MKRLFIDLEVCATCKECSAVCGYFYHPHNNGVDNLREFATFVTVCRKCEEAPCVNSCYHSALEKQEDGVLKRYVMRCTSCKACTIACPFGVILPEFIPYILSKCDYCVGQKEQRLPECIKSCQHKAIEIKEVEEDPSKNIFFVGDSLAVHSRKWFKEDIPVKR